MHRFALILIALLWFAGLAGAQEGVEVEARVEPQRAYLGSTFNYTVTIRSASQRNLGEPVLDLPPALRVLSTGTSFSSRPGRVRDAHGTSRIATVVSQSYTYTLSADRTGGISIPPATVAVDGKEMQTNAVSIEILEPETIEGFDLEARLSRPRAYAGEPVTLRLTWFAAGDVRAFALSGGDLPGGVEAEPINDPAAFRDRSGQYVRTEVFGKPIFGRVSQSARGGSPVLVVTFEMEIRAAQPGAYDLGPFAVVFDTPAGSDLGSRRGVARTAPIRFDAGALPVEGRPGDFTGLIGTYHVQATAAPDRVSVGDPIALRLTVTGTDPLAVQEGPDLASDPKFAASFKLDPGGWEREPTGHEEAIFRTTIRALSDGVTEIPGIGLPYFDAQSGEYRVAISEAIPLSVRPVGTVTLADAVTSSVLAPVAREKLGSPGAGLWSIAAAPELSAGPNGLDPSPVLGVLLVAPPTLLLAHVALGLIRRRSADRRMQDRRALVAACRLARRGRPDEAVRTFLAARLSQHPCAVTAEDCRRATGTPEDADTLARCLAPSESARFGGPPARPDVPPDRLIAILRRLHRAPGVGS